MTMQEKIKKELFARLSEGEVLMYERKNNPTEFTERDKRVLYRLQIEVELLVKLYDGEYDNLNDATWELVDKIILAEV